MGGGGGGGGGDSYCRRPRPRWRRCAQRCRRCWSNFTACPPHLPSPTHTFIHLQPASPHLPYLSLSLFPLSFLFDLSLPPLSFPLPPSLRSPMPRRDREDKNLQVALNSRDSDQCIFLLLSGITGNKQADSLRRGSFPTPSRRHPCGAGAGERGGAGPRGRTGRTRK